MLYPLKFKPVFKDKIWGGDKIRTRLGLDFSPLPNCGEAWVLSGVPGCQTVVSQGFLAGNELNEVLEIYMDDLVGEKAYEQYGNEFPILVKFIDAHEWLSIQVHPDDRLAAQRNTGRGKTEMWYILDAEPGAQLISGFNREMDRELYQKMADRNQFREMMNFAEVSAGDVFYMPAGRVHALGPGILLAEIQQTSDTTYRVYDWDRTDASGKSRELHTEEALDAFDFNYHPDVRQRETTIPGQSRTLVTSPYFTTRLLPMNRPVERDYSETDSFVILLAGEGAASIAVDGNRYPIGKGEVILLPAITNRVEFNPEGAVTLLEVTI